MKALFFLATTFVLSLASACPDFSGKYIDYPDHEGVLLELTQTGCEKLEFKSFYVGGGDKQLLGDFTWILDGVDRASEDPTYPTEIFHEKYQFVGDKLQMDTFIFDKASNKIEVTGQSNMYIDSKKILHEIGSTWDSTGEVISRFSNTFQLL